MEHAVISIQPMLVDFDPMILVKRFVGQDQNFFVSFEFDAQGYWPTPSSVEFKSQPRNVRFGSKADIAGHTINVRFTPKSGHRNRPAYYLRRTNSGSLAMFAAILRASSLVSNLAADSRPAHLTNARSHSTYCIRERYRIHTDSAFYPRPPYRHC